MGYTNSERPLNTSVAKLFKTRLRVMRRAYQGYVTAVFAFSNADIAGRANGNIFPGRRSNRQPNHGKLLLWYAGIRESELLLLVEGSTWLRLYNIGVGWVSTLREKANRGVRWQRTDKD